MLRQIYTSSKTLTTTGLLSFITSWGAMVMVAGVPLSTYKVFLDGSQVYLGKAFGGLPLNRVGGRLAYYSYWDNYTIFAADDITCQLHTDRVLNPLWKPNFISWGDFVDDENNILIHALSNGSIRYYQLDTGTEIATQDLLTYWPNVICWAAPHKILDYILGGASEVAELLGTK